MSLTPGALSTPEETSTPRVRESAIASATLSAIQPARQQPGLARMKIPREAPVERHAVAAGQDRALRRLGVDQQRVGGVLIFVGLGEIRGVGDADRLDRGDAELALDFRDALRALAPMQLQIVGLGRADDLLERRVVGVDAKRDDLGAQARARRQGRGPARKLHSAGSSRKTRSRPCRRPHPAPPPASARWKARRF